MKWKPIQSNSPTKAGQTPATGPRTASLTPFKDTDRSDFANHEGHPDSEAPEMDFTLWLSGVGRFGLQVKDIR